MVQQFSSSGFKVHEFTVHVEQQMFKKGLTILWQQLFRIVFSEMLNQFFSFVNFYQRYKKYMLQIKNVKINLSLFKFCVFFYKYLLSLKNLNKIYKTLLKTLYTHSLPISRRLHINFNELFPSVAIVNSFYKINQQHTSS